MVRIGCLALIGLVLLSLVGVLWLRSKSGLNTAMTDARDSQLVLATQVAHETAEYTDREISRAVMTQSANDMDVVADVAKTGMGSIRDASVAASVASVVSSVANMGTLLLIVLALGIILLLAARIGGA